MKTIKDFKNNLLNRREVQLVITAGKNPGMAESSKKIAEHFKASEDAIVIKALKSKFGIDTFMIDAFIYNTPQDKERIERKKKVKKVEGQAVAPAEVKK